MRPERDHTREEEVLRKKDNRVRDLKVESGDWGLNRRRFSCRMGVQPRVQPGDSGEAGGWTSFANKAKFETTNETYHSVR